MEEKKYVWKDIVKINDTLTVEEFPISGEMEDTATYLIDDFIKSVAAKYGVNESDVTTHMLNHFEVGEDAGLAITTEECGCYINGTPEWEL